MPFATEQKFILRAEEALGRRLPESYAAHMLHSNGGTIDIDDEGFTLHPVRDDSDRKKLGRSANDVVSETSGARPWDGFPASAVAIANNGAGDFLILLPDGAERLGEALFVWEHETGEMRQVASSMAAVTRTPHHQQCENLASSSGCTTGGGNNNIALAADENVISSP